MTRIICWLLSVIALLVVAGVHADWRWFIDLPSMIVAWVFPLVILVLTFPYSELARVPRDLGAPEDAGVGAHQYAADSRIVLTFGVLSLSFGVAGSLIALVAILVNLSDPNIVPAQIAISLQTIMYSCLLNVFVVLPLQASLERCRRRASYLEDPLFEET